MHSPRQVLQKAIEELEASIEDESRKLDHYVRVKSAEIAHTQAVVARLRVELDSTAPASDQFDLNKYTKSHWIREQAIQLLRAAGGRLRRVELIAVLAKGTSGSNDPEQLIRRALSRDARFISHGDSYELNREDRF